MPSSRIPSPARSQGVISTPRKEMRRTRSVGSPARTNIRLSSIIESYKVSPVPHRQSVLNDDTDIDIPRRLSWWKKINDNSRDVLELLERKEIVEVNNVAEEFDVEVLSQENKNYALDLPDSSDGESINSIVIPQRKLFIQKENQPQEKFGQIKNNRETLQKLNKSNLDQDKELNVGRKTLFSQPAKPRPKPVFPAALLDISTNKTVNKTKEIPAAEVKGQVRSLFGGRPGIKRKNMFADFIVSESEDEISEIQPKVFGFQKRNEPKRRASSMSRHSPTSSIDLEMEEWRLLPSSTMVENQINETTSPIKRIKLSNLLETKDSEINTNSNTPNNTKQTNKSISSKNKSKNLSNVHHIDDKSHDIHMTPQNASTTNNSRVTRSMIRSFRENSITASNISKKGNKSKNQTQSIQDRTNELKTGKTNKNISKRDSDIVQEKQNMLIDHPDPDDDCTLECINEVALEIGTLLKSNNKNPKDNTAINLNVDVVEDKNKLVQESNRKISKENVIEQQISTNRIYENQEVLIENKQDNIEKVSNYSKTQNNSQEIRNVVGLNNDNTTVQKLNKSVDNNKNKSRNSIEKYNEHSKSKDMGKETFGKNQSEDVKINERLSKSKQNLNEENHEDQEMESEDEQNANDNYYEQHSDKEEEANKSTKEECDYGEIEEEINKDEQLNNESQTENDNYYEQHSDKEEEANKSTKEECDYGEIEEEINKDEQLNNESQTENVSEEETNNEEEVINGSNTDERDKKIVLDNQCDNIVDKNQVTLPNVSPDTTGRYKNKNKSPEVILHDKTKQIDSFTVQPRNTSVRKTKSIIFHNKLDSVTDFRRSTEFSDATGNSSAEGSGWDSHRTTRKTLRQTFGKDFTPRKSLRALVMEKSAKLQANFTEGVNIVKIPQANSTEYDQVQNELDSFQKTEVQLEQNIEINQEVDVRDVTDRFKNSNKTLHTEERDKTEQIEGRNEVNQSKNKERDVTEPFEDREAIEQNESFERNETEHFDEREEIEESEESEEDEQSEVRKEVEGSDQREEEEESEIREEVEEPEEREEEEESEKREEEEESEIREEVEESEAREEVSEVREEMEESEEIDEMEDSEEREEMEQSEERREMEQSEEREDMEESVEREESEKSENDDRDETESFEKTNDMEQSENEERDDTEQFGEREEVEQSEDEMEQLEEKNDTEPEDEIMAVASDHEVSKRTKQTALETYLQKMQQDNAEKRRKMQEELRNSLKIPKRDAFNLFKVPQRPVQRSIKIQKPKAKKIKSVIPLEMLPSEIIEDMKYKPPKRFQPSNASWITKRLYKFLENKLEPKYDYKARVRAEKLVQYIYNFTKEVRRHDSVRSDGIEELKREMARLDIVKTHFDFYEFCHDFFPREIRIKVVPDIVNNIQLPRHGVFSDILR